MTIDTTTQNQTAADEDTEELIECEGCSESFESLDDGLCKACFEREQDEAAQQDREDRADYGHVHFPRTRVLA